MSGLEIVIRVPKMRPIQVPVADFAEASKIWLRLYDTLLYGWDGRFSETSRILLRDGKPWGYVSQNGRVWEGSPRDWKPGQEPLFNPPGWES